MGIGLSIDDYGSGYSSLTYLRGIPADELKLDRIFVEGISARPVSRSVATATVVLAHSLGMRLVAEGVESVADAQTLADLGCDIIPPTFGSRLRAVVGVERPVPTDASIDVSLARSEVRAHLRWVRASGNTGVSE